MNELFQRTEMLIGREAVRQLQASRVAVFGVGGVGSFAVEGLVRSGIGSLLLVDHDKVALSNCNRQLQATTQTVGMLKTALLADRCRDINPAVIVDTLEAFVLADSLAPMLQEKIDYIVDAVDTVSAKLAIAIEAEKRNIPVISCMGAGNRLDPARFVVDDIYNTSGCPLCRVMRRELRKSGITSLQVVYSTEPARAPLMQPDDNRPGKQTPGSISFVPSVAGMIAAGVVVRNLAGIC